VPQQPLKEAALDGVRWVSLARAGSEILQFGAAVTLARMLAPAEFGRAAVAMIFIPLAVILTYEGFASALVQRAEISREHRETAGLMAIVAGAVLALLTLALAALVAQPLFGDEIASLIRIVSPVFLLAGIGAVPRALLARRLDFRRISLIEVASLITGAVVAVVLAAAGLGSHAIVLGAVSMTAASTLQMVIAARPPRPRWHRAAHRELFAFGLPSALAGMVGVAFTNVDYAILAARLSAHQTGIYWRSFQLGVVYQDKVSSIMLQLAFPVYSRTKSRHELREMHERATRVHAAAIVPMLGTLIVVAPVLIPLVFGPRWEPSVAPAQILAVAGMVAAVLTGYPQVMLAVGKPRLLLGFNLVVLTGYVAAILIAVPYGLVAVAGAVVAIYLGIMAGVSTVLLPRAIGLRPSRIFVHLAPAATGCLALLAAGFPTRWLLEAAGSPRLITLGLSAAVGLGAYVVALQLAFPDACRDLLLLIRRVLPVPRLGRRMTVVTADEPAAAAPPA
jgi:PST family polysaccharide transporter